MGPGRIVVMGTNDEWNKIKASATSLPDTRVGIRVDGAPVSGRTICVCEHGGMAGDVVYRIGPSGQDNFRAIALIVGWRDGRY